MKINNINKLTVVHAEIMNNKKIEIDFCGEHCSVTTINNNGITEHWEVYFPGDDMMFTVLLGVGNNVDDMSTWEKFSKMAGWCRCAHQPSDIEKYGERAITDIIECIECCMKDVYKDMKIQQIIDLV